MAFTLTKTITVPADEPTRVPSLDPTPWRALEHSFASGQTVWIVSHSASLDFLPAGASILNARMRNVSDITRSCGYLTDSRSTISLPTYDIVDKDNTYSNIIADKALNGVGTLNNIIREYEWDAGTQLPSRGNNYRVFSKGTWLVQNHESIEYGTVVRVKCADINRGMDKDIFDPMTWTIAEGISASSTIIKTTIPVAEFNEDPDLYWRPFAHGPHYHYEPSESGVYMRLESTGSESVNPEIIWAADMRVANDYVVIDAVRGRLLTTAQSVEISEGTTAENGPQMMEWVLIDETVTTMYRALTSGFANTSALPAHWNGAVPQTLLNNLALARAASALRLKFENPGKQNLKAFLEKEVLSAVPAVTPINGQGQLVFTPIVIPTDANAGEIVFDESNCVTNKSIRLAHVKTQINTEVEIKYNWDAQREQFNTPVKYRSLDSQSFNGLVKTKTVELKGLHSGIHTPSQIRKLAGVLGDANYFELQEIEIESFINDIQLGTMVSVQFKTPIVLDDANGSNTAKPLTRTMTVTSATEIRSTRTTKYTLHGTLQYAQDFYAGQRLHNLESAEYKRGGIDIAPMVAANNVVLEMGKKYYYVNDAVPGTGLEVASSVNVTVTGSGRWPQIWCFGFLDWTPDINLAGRSGNSGGIGGTQGSDATQGVRGDLGGLDSTIGIRARALYNSFLSSNETQYNDLGRFEVGGTLKTSQGKGASRIPAIVLNANDGILGGYPSDLSGSGGAGSPVSEFTDAHKDTSNVLEEQVLNGKNGGAGGGGIMFVCWGMAMHGRIITSGNNAQVQDATTFNDQVFYGSRGGGGDAGGVLIIVDGSHPRPVINESNLIAETGSSIVNGRREFGVVRRGDPIGPKTGGAGPVNLWQSRHLIIYTPESESLQAGGLNELDRFFANQRDGRVRIIVADVNPSNANLGDMRITQAALDSNDADAPFFILTSSGWRAFVRGVDEFEYVYDALIAGKRKYNSLEIIASSTRPVGEPDGTIWYNPTTKQEWVLYASGDILIRENQVPQGENLIDDISFARSATGERIWVFTRDADLAPVNTRTNTSGGGGTTGGASGITLTDQGRTVAGTATQDNDGTVIADGRQGTISLDDSTIEIFTVFGGNGSFSHTFPSTADNNLGKQASVYVSNAGTGNDAQLTFTYEL